jgi:hypothetical protein
MSCLMLFLNIGNVKTILCLSVVERGSKTDDIFENIAIKINAKVNPTRFLHVFFHNFFSLLERGLLCYTQVRPGVVAD